MGLELIFPLCVWLAIILFVTPVLTGFSHLAFRALTTLGGDPAKWSLFLLAAPIIAPALWLGSAAWHQLENRHAVHGCLVEHHGSGTCFDPYLLAFVALALILRILPFAQLGVFSRTSALDTFYDTPMPARVHALAQHPALKRWPMRVVAEADFAIASRGIRRREILINRDWLASIDDESLLAALLHESAHLQAHDPLRLRLARACIAVNVSRNLLHTTLHNWLNAREIACDDRAVSLGANRLALAQAIASAAQRHTIVSIGCSLGEPRESGISFSIHAKSHEDCSR